MKKGVGRPINHLYIIRQLARQRRSVICPKQKGFDKPKPAAFVLSMQGRMILQMIDKGLFIYEIPATL